MISSCMTFINSNAIVRRAVLFVTVYLTWYGMHTAWIFAHESKFDGMATAAIIAAVLAPLSALQAAAFHTYTQGRSE